MRRPFLPRRVYIVSRAHFALAVYLSPLALPRRRRRRRRLPLRTSTRPSGRAQTRVILKLFYLKFYNLSEPNVSANLPLPRATFADVHLDMYHCASMCRFYVEIQWNLINLVTTIIDDNTDEPNRITETSKIVVKIRIS